MHEVAKRLHSWGHDVVLMLFWIYVWKLLVDQQLVVYILMPPVTMTNISISIASARMAKIAILLTLRSVVAVNARK